MTKMVMIREDNNNISKAPNVVGQSSSVLEFVCVLGRGSFGSVTLIRDSKHRLHAEKSSPIAYMESLKKEHRIMLRFRNHPRIVQTTNPNLHIGINLDHCYMYMEFASKGTLHNFITHFSGQPMPEVMIGRAALMILQGLEALHSHGYVHCDLKPANVLLFPSKIVGEPWDLKLADFGLSKEPSCTNPRSSLSGGTKEYMPPESLGPNRVKMIGPAVDMWALGCVVLQMYGGRPVKLGECFYKWRLPRLVSPLANDFLRRCMALQPSRRATAADLLKHPFVCTKATSYASVLSSSSCHKTQLILW
ncbi:mitogen-activated protein kinase kinase kinase 20-like [Brassica napus]|nr:mitogen-activated protein kinase kinase kinase 20-like [Brassica napus]